MAVMGSNSPAYQSEWSEFILASLAADGSLSLQVPSGPFGPQSDSGRKQLPSLSCLNMFAAIWKIKKITVEAVADF